MTAALACLRDSRNFALAAIEDDQAERDRLDAALSAVRSSIRATKDRVTEIEAAIVALGGKVEE